jgi:hypothetical protein
MGESERPFVMANLGSKRQKKPLSEGETTLPKYKSARKLLSDHLLTLPSLSFVSI